MKNCLGCKNVVKTNYPLEGIYGKSHDRFEYSCKKLDIHIGEPLINTGSEFMDTDVATFSCVEFLDKNEQSCTTCKHFCPDGDEGENENYCELLDLYLGQPNPLTDDFIPAKPSEFSCSRYKNVNGRNE